MFRSLFQRGTEATAPTYTHVGVDVLKAKLDAGEALVLLDVRSADEYAHDGHIPGARLIPLPVLAQRAAELPRDRTIAIVCRSGNRSQVACDLLARMGYTDLVNVSGGMIAWQRAGLPTRRQ